MYRNVLTKLRFMGQLVVCKCRGGNLPPVWCAPIKHVIARSGAPRSESKIYMIAGGNHTLILESDMVISGANVVIIFHTN